MERRGAIEWPAQSADLSPLIFFYVVTLKVRIYTTQPASLEELRERITFEYNEITKFCGMCDLVLLFYFMKRLSDAPKNFNWSIYLLLGFFLIWKKSFLLLLLRLEYFDIK